MVYGSGEDNFYNVFNLSVYIVVVINIIFFKNNELMLKFLFKILFG